jgi:hypothetical protein
VTTGRGRAARTAAVGVTMLCVAAAALPTTGAAGAALPSAGAAQSAKPKAKLTPMPAKPTPGKWKRPVFPARSVPAYFTSTNLRARVAAGSGAPELVYGIPTPAGSASVWGDWDGNGSTSPAVFTAGHWLVFDRIIGSNPKPTRELDFGAAGDRPIAGDWNGDGRTDIGVVRGNVWSLSLGTTPAGLPGTVQPVWRTFGFGAVGDRVVVGDWNGDGHDGIGVMRRGKWFLRQTATGGKPGITFTFGVPKRKKSTGKLASTFRGHDVAVVGDWNADKTDTVGVVRGSTWYLATKNGPSRDFAHQTRLVTRPAGGVPAPWSTVAGPTGAACPTAGRRVATNAKYVVASRILDKALPYATTTSPAFAVRTALLQSERYLVGAQYEQRWAARRAQTFTDVRAKAADEEFAIRWPAMAALTAAIAARTSAHVDKTVGRSRNEVIAYADWLVRSIACEHASVTFGGWGSGFQTAHWAQLTGEAAWLIWDTLTPQTRDYVADMVVSEADFRLGQPTPYWTDKAGIVVPGFEGNTRAEDDSWNAALLELAVDMMPKAPRAYAYRAKAIQLETGAYATRADLTNPTLVNGVPVSQRLGGSNILDDGTLINHGILHPDYATNIQQLWWAADLAGLAGKAVPEAAFHNASLVYNSMSLLPFTAGAASPAGGVYAPPGGTIYRPGSNDIYYPQGSDWGTVRRAPFMSFDAHAMAYGIGPAPAWNPAEALAFHTSGQLALDATSGAADGRTYSVNPAVAATQDTYPGREEYAAQQVATAWLALYVKRNAGLRIDTGTYPPTTSLPGTTALRGWRQPGTSSSTTERPSP